MVVLLHLPAFPQSALSPEWSGRICSFKNFSRDWSIAAVSRLGAALTGISRLVKSGAREVAIKDSALGSLRNDTARRDLSAGSVGKHEGPVLRRRETFLVPDTRYFGE